MTNTVSKAASILGRKARGKPKRLTPRDRERRRRQMIQLNQRRAK